jgi:hypothetical protein
LMQNRRTAFVARQFVLFLIFALLYFWIRGITEAGADQARRNAERLIDLEQRLGIFWEERLQSLILNHSILVDLANWAYIWLHWPAIAIGGIYLAARSRDGYTLVRNAFFISGGIGLIIFATFPVMPPRLAMDVMVDTVTERSYSYRVLQPPGLTNQYAALPSLHFGWNLLIGIGLYWKAHHRLIRALGVVIPAAVFASVILTANHYVIDPIVGGLLALFGLGVAVVGRRIWDSWAPASIRWKPSLGGARSDRAESSASAEIRDQRDQE